MIQNDDQLACMFYSKGVPFKSNIWGFKNTVGPPVNDHPPCQGYVVVYDRWSLFRDQTTGGLKFG